MIVRERTLRQSERAKNGEEETGVALADPLRGHSLFCMLIYHSLGKSNREKKKLDAPRRRVGGLPGSKVSGREKFFQSPSTLDFQVTKEKGGKVGEKR